MNYDKKFILDSIKRLGNRYGTHESFRDGARIDIRTRKFTHCDII